MTRVVFAKGQLDQFLTSCKTIINMSLPQLAQIISVERHTLNDWRRDKLLPSLEKLKMLADLSNTPLPPSLETKSDTWGPVKAGLVRQEKYGCTLSTNDRVKGGRNSQVARKAHPDYYGSLGCIITNNFTQPGYCIELAELIGTILGDGCITNSQLHITLNSKLDIGYAYYLQTQIKNLFNYSPSILKSKGCNAVNVVITGVNFISYLKSIGLRVGDKVRQQVDVPKWIKQNPEFSRWCLRGLMDTDGGIFTNSYTINGKSYIYPKANFTNASQPLLNFVYDTLKHNGFNPNNKQPRKIWLYSQVESRRYLKVIGSSNSRLLKKIR